jgi:hypothetical protein
MNAIRMAKTWKAVQGTWREAKNGGSDGMLYGPFQIQLGDRILVEGQMETPQGADNWRTVLLCTSQFVNGQQQSYVICTDMTWAWLESVCYVERQVEVE